VDIPTIDQAVTEPDALARFAVAAYRATRPPIDRKQHPIAGGYGGTYGHGDDLIADLHRSAGISAWQDHLRPYANALAAETSAREAHAAEKSSATRKQLKQAIQNRENAETSARAWWDTQQGYLGEAAAKAAGPKPWQPPETPRVTAVMFTN
jgi:hypothetical protein